VTTRCEDREPIRQEPTEPFVEHERELQQPLHMKGDPTSYER
jgi:hypothetical protein